MMFKICLSETRLSLSALVSEALLKRLGDLTEKEFASDLAKTPKASATSCRVLFVLPAILKVVLKPG